MGEWGISNFTGDLGSVGSSFVDSGSVGSGSVGVGSVSVGSFGLEDSCSVGSFGSVGRGRVVGSKGGGSNMSNMSKSSRTRSGGKTENVSGMAICGLGGMVNGWAADVVVRDSGTCDVVAWVVVVWDVVLWDAAG
jgi:hypothetical protein